MLIRPARRDDAEAWEHMRCSLWPSDADDHAAEIASYFEGPRKNSAETLLAFNEQGRPLGFVELSIRNHAEGCSTERVAFLEGWYVELDARRQGVGAALVKAAEEWGRAQGCTEFASDTELDNYVSAAAHRALGFVETERIICFKKEL